jgi:hypothetical protein
MQTVASHDDGKRRLFSSGWDMEALLDRLPASRKPRQPINQLPVSARRFKQPEHFLNQNRMKH